MATTSPHIQAAKSATISAADVKYGFQFCIGASRALYSVVFTLAGTAFVRLGNDTCRQMSRAYIAHQIKIGLFSIPE